MENNVNKIIQKRKNRAVLKRKRFAFVKKIITIAIVLTIVMFFVFGITTTHGVDMSPAVKDGDIVVYFRINSNYACGDIVVFKHNGKDYVSRIAAVKGDILSKGNNGRLIFNERIHPINKDEGLFYETSARRKINYPITIKDNEYFVLGDKRDTAEDSRYFGVIKKSQIKGKVFSLIRKRGL